MLIDFDTAKTLLWCDSIEKCLLENDDIEGDFIESNLEWVRRIRKLVKEKDPMKSAGKTQRECACVTEASLTAARNCRS